MAELEKKYETENEKVCRCCCNPFEHHDKSASNLQKRCKISCFLRQRIVLLAKCSILFLDCPYASHLSHPPFPTHTQSTNTHARTHHLHLSPWQLQNEKEKMQTKFVDTHAQLNRMFTWKRAAEDEVAYTFAHHFFVFLLYQRSVVEGHSLPKKLGHRSIPCIPDWSAENRTPQIRKSSKR